MGISAYAIAVADDGIEVRIADINVGDSLREAVSGKQAQVLNVWQGPAVGMFHIEALNGSSVDLTEDHRLLTERGPVWANEIKPKMKLRCGEGWIECVAASPLHGDFMVYDVKLQKVAGEDAWLLVNGLVVGG